MIRIRLPVIERETRQQERLDVEIDISQDAWQIKYGENRGKKVTFQVGNNIAQSMRPGDEFTLSLVLPHAATAGDSVSVKIKVVSID